MRPNGSGSGDLSMAPARQSHLVFGRITRHAVRLSKSSETSDVHRFRTNARRVETLIDELCPQTRNQEKLLKLLSKLRKKAGRLRDLDVQIAFLRNLKIPDRQNHRAQLLEWLGSEQARRSRKLPKNFDQGTVRELRKRLRRARAEMSLEGIDPLKLALNRLPKPIHTQLTEKDLHACRNAAKRSRYLAELAGESPEAKFVIEQLKNAQDVIGEWHDVLKLKEKAEQHFGGVRDSVLVSALQNISRARFRRATSALLSAIAEISERQQRSVAKSAERKPAEVETARTDGAPRSAVA